MKFGLWSRFVLLTFRFASILQYAMSLVFGLANLLVVCRPSTFKRDFHWDGQPYDLYQPDGTLSPLFCEGEFCFKKCFVASEVGSRMVGGI